MLACSRNLTPQFGRGINHLRVLSLMVYKISFLVNVLFPCPTNTMRKQVIPITVNILINYMINVFV